MSRRTGAALVLLAGVTLVRLGASGAHRRYVRASMGPWLVASGAVLVLLALWSLLRADDDAPDGVAHDHGHGLPRVAALLVLPVAAVFLAAPAPLGSFAAKRAPAPAAAPSAANALPLSSFEPLPDQVDGAVPFGLGDYTDREVYGGGATLDGVNLQLVGFVVASPDRADSFFLTRFRIACCAADATPVEVLVTGVEDVPDNDAWVAVTGTHVAGFVDGRAVFAATAVRSVKAPSDPYET